MSTNILCIEGLHLGQVDTKVGQIERGELHPSHPPFTLAVRRAGWDLERASIPATKWFDYHINRPEDDQTDWIIFTSKAVPTNCMPESKPLNPEHNICIKALLGRNQVADAIRLASRERRISPFHIAIKRSEWPSDRTINGSDWKPELYTDWSDDWELWVADPMAFASDHEPPLSYCIRSGMHISEIQETMTARRNELEALTLANYCIRRDQWQSNQPSVTADKWDIGKLWQDRTLAAVDLDATDWAIYFIPVVVNVPSPEQATPAAAMQIMRSLMQADESWAWSWHCNLAMMAVDTGADRLSANHGAAEFMRQAFEVDMNASQTYRNLITGLEVERDKKRIETQRIDKVLSELTALDVRHAIPITCADCRIDPSQLWIRRASWTADADSIQASELKLHQPIKLSDPEPTDWEIWVKPHQDRSCEIQPKYLMMQVSGQLVEAQVQAAMEDVAQRRHLLPAHFAIRQTEWPANTYSLNGTEWKDFLDKGFLGRNDSPAPDETDWELWIYDEQSVAPLAELPVSSPHCLTLAEWLDGNTLSLGEYRGYTGRHQVDWDAEVICGDVYALGKKVATFGGNSVTKAKLDFQLSVDNYITRCQAKAQVEEDLLGAVHD